MLGDVLYAVCVAGLVCVAVCLIFFPMLLMISGWVGGVIAALRELHHRP